MNDQRNGGTATVEEEGEAEVGTLELLAGDNALSAVDRAAIDIQVATAKRYPRSVDKSLKEALTLATLDEDTAASMFYALPRGGKTIEGPSARLAEVMAYSWGNLRVDADIVAEDKTTVTAMGTCFDLEKNVAVRVRVKRRITDKKGSRFNEDMIGVTSNAAISIALRNCVFKVIPRSLVDRIYGEARRASLGKGGTMAQKRQRSLEWFTKVGVTAEQVFAVLGVRGLDDVGEDQLITLRGLATAIKDGETTVEKVFGREEHSEGTDELNQALGGKATAATSTPAAPPKEQDDGSPASRSQLKQLAGLREEARGLDLLTSDGEVELDRIAEARDGLKVREQIRSISQAVLRAKAGGSGQADLLGKEG